MKHFILYAIAALSGFGSWAQSGLGWSAASDVNAAGEGALRPRIALNGAGDAVILWGKNGPNSNHVAVGNGSGFSAPMEVSTAGCVPAVADWMGSSIAATGNTVWVVMKATPEESKPLYVRRSDDGGITWGDTLRVDPFDGLVSRFPSIDVIDPDAPVVQYMQFDNGWNGARQVVSHRMGGSFMAPVQVSAPYAPGEVCDCCPNQVVQDNDHVVALYRNAGTNVRVMWGAVSTDGGTSYPLGAMIDNTNWVLNACPSSGPDGYLAGDSIRYVWMSGASNGAKIYLGSARAGDLSLGSQRSVHPGQPTGTQQNFPRIAGNGDTLGVVWENYLNGARDIFFSWSVTGVTGLSVPEVVNTEMTGAQRTPDIAFRSGAFHIIWADDGSAQVRYRKATVLGASAISEIGNDVVQCWPNPVSDVLNVEGAHWNRAVIIDALGKVFATVPVKAGMLDMSTAAPGGYTIHLAGPGGAKATVRVQKR